MKRISRFSLRPNRMWRFLLFEKHLETIILVYSSHSTSGGEKSTFSFVHLRIHACRGLKEIQILTWVFSGLWIVSSSIPYMIRVQIISDFVSDSLLLTWYLFCSRLPTNRQWTLLCMSICNIENVISVCFQLFTANFHVKKENEEENIWIFHKNFSEYKFT